MSKVIYKIEFFSNWHCGSGLSGGADADQLVIKDSNGLPFIPGKTLKGLLKCAGEELKEINALSESFIDTIFGKKNDGETTESGCGYFSNATLTETLQKSLVDGTNQQLLFRNVNSTSIDDKGQAVEHSLRSKEVVIPLTLFAEIDGVDKSQKDNLEKCLKMVKYLGTNRHRGLGRCDLSIVEVK